MKPVVVTASTMMELSMLIDASSASAVAGAAPLRLFSGALGGRELLLAVTGIGKVNAASSTTLLLERFDPEFIINTGCGGAFRETGLSVGDLAVARSESFADEGVQTPAGWQGLDLIGIPLYEGRGEKFFNTFPLDAELADRAVDAARGCGRNAVAGPFLTVSTCSGTESQGRELLNRFPGICENMEGAAVAHVAFAYGVPLLEVRGISNMVEDRDLSRWDLKGAVSEAQRFLLAYLRS